MTMMFPALLIAGNFVLALALSAAAYSC